MNFHLLYSAGQKNFFLQYSQVNVCAAKHLKACNVIKKGSNTGGLLNAYCEIFESTYFDAIDCL